MRTQVFSFALLLFLLGALPARSQSHRKVPPPPPSRYPVAKSEQGPIALQRAPFLFNARRGGFLFAGFSDSLYLYTPHGPADFRSGKKFSQLIIREVSVNSVEDARRFSEFMAQYSPFAKEHPVTIQSRKVFVLNGGTAVELYGTFSENGGGTYYQLLYYKGQRSILISAFLNQNIPALDQLQAAIATLRFK